MSLALVSPIVAPQLLAFPHQKTFGDTTVYSELPIDPKMESILKRSDALLKQSGIYSDSYGRSVFVTQDGWRWNWLALTSRGGVGLTRPVSPHSVILSVKDIAQDLMPMRGTIGKQRSLSGTIAHERTHQLIHAHFGLWSSVKFPNWKVEGYCEFIAQETTLTEQDAAQLKKAGEAHPAMVYFEGRRDVTAILAKNGGSIDQLFAR